jgi:hypothetical protein
MKISDPVLVPDVSDWCDHINPKEFEDGGCASVVVGLYPAYDNQGNKVLSPISRQHCIDVATKSSLVLQAYFWDDLTRDPLQQADWLVNIIRTEGLPIRWIWIDQEQWWLDWTAWQQARGGLIPQTSVSKGTPAAISGHFEAFNRQFHDQISQSGVYTNMGFVSSWAPGMDAWLTQYYAWVPHYGRQPKEATLMTWANLKESWMPDYEVILSAGQKPEMVAGHQFTGDTCILPGSYNKGGLAMALDVSVFSKTFIEWIRNNDLTGGQIVTPIPIPTPVQPPATQPGPDEYVVLYARINVRSKPSSDGTWVRYALKDEVLHVVSIANSWAKLTDGNYVFADYIRSLAPPAPPAPPSVPVQPAGVEYVVLFPRVNVRSQPSSDSAWVRYAVKDEVLQVVKMVNGWARLADGSYVFADYIHIKQAEQPAPSVPPSGVETPAAVDYVVLFPRINVRAMPSAQSAWVRFAVKDEVLHVVKVENGWAQTSEGTYVLADYLQKA